MPVCPRIGGDLVKVVSACFFPSVKLPFLLFKLIINLWGDTLRLSEYSVPINF